MEVAAARAHDDHAPRAGCFTLAAGLPFHGQASVRATKPLMRVVAALGGDGPCYAGASSPTPLRSGATSRSRWERSRSSLRTRGRGDARERPADRDPGPSRGRVCREPPDPLDVLGAETRGMIGYLLDQELTNELGGRPVATLLTQVVVDPDDPAFETDQADRPRLRTRRGRAARGGAGLAGGARRGSLPAGRCLPEPGRSSSCRPSDCSSVGRACRLRRRGRDPGRQGGRPAARRRGRDRQGPGGRAPGARTGGRRAPAPHRPARGGGRLGHVSSARSARGDRRGASRDGPRVGIDGPEGRGRLRFAERTGGFAGIGSLGDAAGTKEDHIAPAKSVFIGSRLFGGP